MSRDATGLYSGWAKARSVCPTCRALPGAACDLAVEGYSEHGVHHERTVAYCDTHRLIRDSLEEELKLNRGHLVSYTRLSDLLSTEDHATLVAELNERFTWGDMDLSLVSKSRLLSALRDVWDAGNSEQKRISAALRNTVEDGFHDSMYFSLT